jgi:hypothetical protein
VQNFSFLKSKLSNSRLFKEMTKEKKLSMQLAVATGLCIIGCGLLIAGFIVAPLGIIDSSVLVAFGETCTFAGALFGVDYHYKAKEK